jgi:cysteine desulfurase
VECLGGIVTHVEPDGRGIVDSARVARALRHETVFVSVGWANNEIGVIQPLADIARAIRSHEHANGTRVLFHADAGQGPLYKTPYVHTLGVDLFSLGSGKLYGPRGVGALYVSNRAELAPLILGGNQERGMRAGTESPALAAGFAEAFAAIASERAREARRLAKLRDALARDILRAIPGAVLNGDLAHALPHMLNVSIPQISGEYLVLSLDRRGISAATKSACEEGAAESHVVAALIPGEVGKESWRAANTVRFSLGRDTSERDVRRVRHILSDVVARSAGMTPSR